MAPAGGIRAPPGTCSSITSKLITLPLFGGPVGPLVLGLVGP